MHKKKEKTTNPRYHSLAAWLPKKFIIGLAFAAALLLVASTYNDKPGREIYSNHLFNSM